MNPKRRTWWIWLVAAVVVLAVLGGAAWLLVGSAPASNPVASSSASATATPTPTTTPTPKPTATATSTAAPTSSPTATAPTTSTASPTPAPTVEPPAPPPLAEAYPFIVAADWDPASSTITVSATVPQLVESDGTCTITATKGAVSVSDAFGATPSAGSTDCGTRTLSSPDFSAGDWIVTVSYASSTSAGSATNPNPVTIP